MIERRRVEGAEEASNDELLRRFVYGQDEAAFATLLRRHGPLVLRVCRHVLHDAHDAEDAFQATFLVLARKAGAIRRQESLPAWLYRVAHRIAVKTRSGTARRRASERGRINESGAVATAGEPCFDVREVVHNEVDALSTKYRLPVVLCYLQGKSNEEAARELGWPVGTVKIRLLRARHMLRGRLSRRGLAFGASVLALLWAEEALPAALAETTLQAVAVEGRRAPVRTARRGLMAASALALACFVGVALLFFPSPGSVRPGAVPRGDTARSEPALGDTLSGGDKEPPVPGDLPGDEGPSRFLVVSG